MSNRSEDPGPFYTLAQIAELSGIHSMLLESYLHSAAWRIPTVWVAGEERYPPAALTAFQEMHEEAQRASAPAADRHPESAEATHWGGRRLLSLTAQRRSAPAHDGAARTPARETPAAAAPPPMESQSPPARPVPGREADPSTAGAPAGGEPPASAPQPRRPVRRLYTLQQVHERTGIPYPVLALYAASEAGRIPAAGERHSLLYPWEALAAFCRIHVEKDPSWHPPALPSVPPSPEEEEENRQLSARLERLERSQSELAEQIRSLLDEGEDYLPATVAQDRPPA